jgi:hypothetical protein
MAGPRGVGRLRKTEEAPYPVLPAREIYFGERESYRHRGAVTAQVAPWRAGCLLPAAERLVLIDRRVAAASAFDPQSTRRVTDWVPGFRSQKAGQDTLKVSGPRIADFVLKIGRPDTGHP